MEVHHTHHPTHKKNWKEYLLEFFMLFFAVTLGFFAENIREKISEEHKTKELLEVVAKDFKTDIESLKSFKEAFILKDKQCDTLLELINMPAAKIPEKLYYDMLKNYNVFWLFNSNDKSRIEAEAKGLFLKREYAELAHYVSKYNFYLKDYKELDNLMVGQSKICMYEIIPYITNADVYTNTAVREKLSADKVGIKNPREESILRLKYLLTNTKADLKFYTQWDIDSMVYFAQKSIEIIEKKD